MAVNAAWAANEEALRMDGAVLVRDTEPRGFWRFDAERHNGRVYGAVAFFWPDGEGRERFFGAAGDALRFWRGLAGRVTWEASTMAEVGKFAASGRAARPEAVTYHWQRD